MGLQFSARSTAQSGKQCGTPAGIRQAESVQPRRKNDFPVPPRRKRASSTGTSHFSPSHAISHCRSSVSPPRSNLRVSHNPLLSPRHFCTSHQPPSPPLLAFSRLRSGIPALGDFFFGLDDFARPPSRVSQARTRFRRLVYPPKRAPLVPCLLTSTLLQSLVPLHCCAACTISLAGCASAYFSSPRVPA